MKIDGKLWHQAKHTLGTRNGRKRGSKVRGGMRAKTRVMEEYLNLLKHTAETTTETGV